MSWFKQNLKIIKASKKVIVYTFILLFLFYIISPFTAIIVNGFGEGWFGDRWLPESFSFKWLQWAMDMTDIYKVTINSFIIAGIAIVISLLVGIPTSWALAKHNVKIKEVLIAFILLPRMIPPITFALGVAKVFYALNLVDTYLGIAMAHGIIATPYVILIMTSTFESLDDRLLEAGNVCGGNWFDNFLYITIPLSLPGVLSSVIFGFVTSFNEFTLTMMTYGKDTVTLPIQTYLSIGDGFQEIASAISLILLIPSVIILFLITKYIKPENALGGVKGL